MGPSRATGSAPGGRSLTAASARGDRRWPSSTSNVRRRLLAPAPCSTSSRTSRSEPDSTLVGRDAGDVHEPGDLVRAAGDRDHSTAVRVADEDDGAVELVDNRRRVGSVVREAAQRVRRRENGVTVIDEPVEHRPPAGRVSERAVNENNCRTRHDEFLSFRWAIAMPVAGSHQATFSRWLRPRASTTLACTGATSSLALSEPNGAPTTVRTARLPLA